MKLGLAAAVLVVLAGAVPASAAIVTYNIEGVGNVNGGTYDFDLKLIGDPLGSGGSFSSGVFSLTLDSGSAIVPPYTFPLTNPKFTLTGDAFALFAGGSTTPLLSFNLTSGEAATATTSPTSFDFDTFSDVVFNTAAIGQNADVTGSVTSFTAAVPEPSTWAMMILGFCALSFMARRRKQNRAAFSVA